MYPDTPQPLRAGTPPAESSRHLRPEESEWKAERRQEPERIAIIGAGPVGLEAALYAHRLGMKVFLFEREARPSAEVRGWEHVSMFTPWGDNRTPLGELALAGRSRGKNTLSLPPASVYPTGSEFLALYLDPLSQLLGESLRLETRVVGVGRSYLFPEDFALAPERRETRRFRLLTRSPLEERLFSVDHVLDTSGVTHSPRWVGAGGLPALGEMGSERHILRGIPDVLGKDRIHFLGKSTLLVGDGPSAATSAVLLAEVLDRDPAGSLVWATRSPSELPVAVTPGHSLPRRELILKKANLIVAGKHPRVEHLPVTQVEAVQHSLATGRFRVTLQVGRITRRSLFDTVVANVGSRVDSQTFERSLQPDEPGFYTLGSKLCRGCPDGALLRDSWPHICDVFRRITGNMELDLYADAAAQIEEGAATGRQSRAA